MDTHAIYEGAMRLLAAIESGMFADPCYGEHHILTWDDADIQRAVDLATRTWKAAHQASGFTSKAVAQ